MTYLINPEARGTGGVCHMTDHVFLACLLSILLRAVCWPLLPGCEFWCGRVVLLTKQAISRTSSTASPFSTSCEGWVGACVTCFLTMGISSVKLKIFLDLLPPLTCSHPYINRRPLPL